MSFLKPLKIFWIVGSAYFTVISAIMYIVSLSDPNQLLRADRFLLILLLSFIMGLGTALYWACGFNKVLAFCLHAGIYNAGFALFLWMSGMKFEAIIIGTLIFIAVYTVSTIVARLLYKSLRPQKKDATVASLPQKKQKNSAPSEKKSADKTENVSTDTKRSKKNTKEEYKNLFS